MKKLGNDYYVGMLLGLERYDTGGSDIDEIDISADVGYCEEEGGLPCDNFD